MQGEALKGRIVKRGYKIIDDKYVVSMQRAFNYYYMFFESTQHEAFLKSDPTKLLTCIMVSKPKMNQFMKDNLRNWRNLPSNQLDRFMVQKVKQFMKFVCDLDHENILKIIAVRQSTANLYIILERYQTLTDYVDSRGPLKEREVLSMSEGLVSALSHLSSKNIISARLNPDFLVVHQNKIKMNFLCFIKHHQIEDLSLNLCRRVAVENQILFYSQQVMKNCSYSLKCDVWSLGAIFYYLLSKKFIFKSFHELISPQFLRNQTRHIIQNTNEMFQPLISKMLVIQEEGRANIQQIEHIFSVLSDKDDQSKNIKVHQCSKLDCM